MFLYLPKQQSLKSYALENHYMVDDMAMLALSAKIDAICASKKMITLKRERKTVATHPQ